MKNLSVVCALILLFICAGIAHAKPKVLFIESYHSGYKWDQEMTRGLESVLKDKVELFDFQMDTKRVKVSEYEGKADQAWQYYLEMDPDVVLLADDNALKLLAGRFLMTGTPVVYMGINNNPRNYAPLGKNITGVLERPLYKRTVKYLKEMFAFGDDKVLILLDKGTTSQVFRHSVFKDRTSQVISGITTDVESFSDYCKWQEAVRHAAKNGYRAIVIGLYHRLFDAKGLNVDGEKVLRWTSENSPVPVFAFWKMSVGKDKAVGGMVMSGEEQGRAAGEMILQILGGTPINTIQPITPPQGEFFFSQSELDKWKIRLPRYIKKQAIMLE